VFIGENIQAQAHSERRTFVYV